MRRIGDYNIVFSDIDNTLVYGWMTDLMEITWKLFHSDLISDILMYLQAKFRLYKVNEMVRYQLLRARDVVFLTARKECKATHKLIEDIMGREFLVESLRTDNSPEDKTNTIKTFNDRWNICYYGDENYLFFEDNKETRWKVMKELPNVLALDPVPMRDVLIG